jgi:hypothetical protein
VKRLIQSIGLVLLLAACATPSGPTAPVALEAVSAARFSWAEIKPIIVPLAYRDVLGKKCHVPEARVKAAFLADLKSAGASDALINQAQGEAARIERAERDTLKEYVCTAELFDSTETNAKAALQAWRDLKGRRS